MDSKLWLMCQFKSMKKATGREELKHILFPDFSKAKSRVLAGVFDMIARSPHVSICHQQTKLPAPAFPQGSEQRGHPLALRWVTVPSQLFCQFVSFRTFRVTNTLKKQSVMGANRKYPFLCSETELFVPSQILPLRKCRANGAVRDESPALRQSFVNNSLGMAQNWKK